MEQDNGATEFRIDDLAREAGTTVRNVRAYAERGLLPSPERRGRVAIYTSVHLARLRMILALLGRGYSLASIGELLGAWQAGQELGEVLGLEEAITRPWSDEVPERLQVTRLLERFGLEPNPESLARAVALGLVEIDAEGVRAPSPKLLEAGADIVAMGVPLEAVLAEFERLRRHTAAIAEGFVELASSHLFEPSIDTGRPLEAARLAGDVWHLRDIAREVTRISLERALEEKIKERMGSLADRVTTRGRTEE